MSNFTRPSMEISPHIYNGSKLELSYLPNLSTHHEIHRCYYNNNYICSIFSELLPSNVQEVSFYENQITTDGLPERWPGSLKSIILDRNQIINTFPIAEWPEGLCSLSLDDNPLECVPDRLPSNLDTLSMSYCNLIILKNLPTNLKKLRAYYNKISRVHKLPDTLEYLNLGYNFITSISMFRNILPSSLKVLNLDNNDLTYLPENLPDTIENLSVVGNQIKHLPNNLPASLKILILNKNRIREFQPKWKDGQRLFQLHIRDNCITENLIYLKEGNRVEDVFQANNWNQDYHHIQAWRIQKAFRVFKLKTGIRVWARYKRILDELIEVSYSPSLVIKYHYIESLKKYLFI